MSHDQLRSPLGAPGRTRPRRDERLESSDFLDVTAFTERYPHVDVSVELSMRHVNLVQEGFDVALRASGKLSASSLVARKAPGREGKPRAKTRRAS